VQNSIYNMEYKAIRKLLSILPKDEIVGTDKRHNVKGLVNLPKSQTMDIERIFGIKTKLYTSNIDLTDEEEVDYYYEELFRQLGLVYIQ